MLITRMSLPRRTFLRGAGVAIALPFLDAMMPALTAAAKTPASGTMRLGFFYVPNGMFLDNFHPKGSGGRNFEMTPILKPLEGRRKGRTSRSARPSISTPPTSWAPTPRCGRSS
jgi:hypothetical protein